MQLLFKGSEPPKSLATPAGFQNTNQTIDLRNNELGKWLLGQVPAEQA